MLSEKIAEFRAKSKMSPRELLEKSAYPDPDDMVIKSPDSDQAIIFKKNSKTLSLSAQNSSIRLYEGRNSISLHGSVVIPGDMMAFGDLRWGLQALNPMLKLPAMQFLVLTPQVQAALTAVLNNPAIGGQPGTVVAGQPIFLKKPEISVFSQKTLSVLKDAGIDVGY